MAAAAAADKLDHEFLSSRGIRVTSPEFMRPAFPEADPSVPIEIVVTTSGNRNVTFKLNNDNTPYSKWVSAISSGNLNTAVITEFASVIASLNPSKNATSELIQILTKEVLRKADSTRDLSNFVIFSPENSALRTFDREGQLNHSVSMVKAY